MIELRGLHLGNIARSPAESVRPDLWPDHAWVPALGCTGGVLYDLCGGRHGVIPPSMSWVVGRGLKGGETYADEYNILSVGYTIDPRAWRGLTVFVHGIHLAPATTGYPTIVCHTPAGELTGPFLLSEERHQDYPLQIQCVSRVLGISTDPVLVSPFYGSLAMTWGSFDRIRLYQNGELIQSSSGTTNFSTLHYSGSLYETLINGQYRSGWRSGRLTYEHVSIFSSSKTRQQLSDLTADPLLPFRRRQPVYYSVPSGGGTSLAASSAWRVFTAAAIDTAWAIRAALAGSTSWAVLTQSGAATGWRIAAASDTATGWRIAADLDADTAWAIRAAAASPAAWRILAASESDTAWRIAADLNASTAWAICTSMDAATAWAIIAAGTLLANTGWAIRTDADTDTGWRLKTDAAADTAWAVRNARDAATAWDIQAALAGATAWRITTDLQTDTAWTVITDMGADAAWNILRADPTGTAWRVCTDLDTPTAWAVFSDIIPEPVRVFLAPGRQFIINAASRVLIITKTRP